MANLKNKIHHTELDVIYNECVKVFQYSFDFKSRKQQNIVARAVFFRLVNTFKSHFRKHPTLNAIGSRVNLDHATVLHGLKMWDVYENYFKGKSYRFSNHESMEDCYNSLYEVLVLKVGHFTTENLVSLNKKIESLQAEFNLKQEEICKALEIQESKINH
mgnify:CR=1 FL=1